MNKNPFDDHIPTSGRVNPFGEEAERVPVDEAISRMEHAARKIRLLRAQVGAEGLSPSATREMLDEIGRAFEMGASALKDLRSGNDT